MHTFPAILLDAREDQIVSANALACACFGFGHSSLSKFRPLLRSSAQEFGVFVDAVDHYGQYATRDINFRTASGEVLNLECRAKSLGDYQFVLNFIDLNEQARKARQHEADAFHADGLFGWQRVQYFFGEMERQNRLILDAAGEGIYGIDAQGKATFVNRAAQEMLGWNAEDLIGRELHAIIHHRHLNGGIYPARECPIYDTFRKEKVQRIENDAFWRKDGNPILVDYVSTPIYDHNVLAGAVVIFRDVTESRATERKLRKALEQVENLSHQLEQENDYLQQEIFSHRAHDDILGVSSAVRGNIAQVSLVAETDSNVLITGEGGTGKSLIASAIHKSSKRAKRPLVVVNCAAISNEDYEATFFGYVKRAFVGALQDHAGKLSIAQNGTLMFKDITAMPLDFQAKLVETLQTGTFQRIGDERINKIDLRLISTTSHDLKKAVLERKFREDLYFMLSVFPIHCHPLRNRPEDIPHLAIHYLKSVINKHQLPDMRISKQNDADLQAHNWPGNVRELIHTIERAALIAHGGKLNLQRQKTVTNLDANGSDFLTSDQLREVERQNLISCLRHTQGIVSGQNGAAELLGLKATTVYSKIKTANITKSDWKRPV